jgi:hypothetical protein
MKIQSDPRKSKSPHLSIDCGLFFIHCRPLKSIDSRGYRKYPQDSLASLQRASNEA